MSLAQGVCLISWSPRIAVTWALLGSLGWIAGAMATGVFEEVFVLLGLERHDAFAVWVCIFSVQSFFFLPAVIMLDKAALAQRRQQIIAARAQFGLAGFEFRQRGR